jgi:hypothetical protein
LGQEILGETFPVKVNGEKSGARRLFSVMPLLAWAALCVSAFAEPLIPVPKMLPPGETGWIGSTRFTFEKPLGGKIFYTLDGSEPDNKVDARNLEWKEGFVPLTKTTNVRAVHYLSGLSSDVVSADFNRAKLPAPTARYGGNTSFYPSVICTLTVVRTGNNNDPTIKFTLDGTPPNAGSPVYVTPIPIDKSTILRAYAVETGFDDSEPMQVNFTVPPPVAAPQATPASQPFSTNTLVIRFRSASPAPYFRYTLDTALKDWSTAPIVSGDSISIVGKTPGEVITVRTQTWKAGYPPSGTTTERYTYLPAVATPIASRPKGFFYDIDSIQLTSATKDASIRYVVADNQVPGPNSLDGSKPIYIENTTHLRAIALKPPQPQSGTLDINYELKLSAPTLDKGSREFTDVLKVCITARAPHAAIYYSHETNSPTAATGILIGNGQCIDIGADSTDLWVRAVKDTVLGEVAFARYIKKTEILKLSAPTVLPETREFEDSQLVYLGLEPGVAAQIRYTTNGTSPTAASKLYVEGFPILLDSTTKLRCQAFPTAGKLEASSVREDIFVLNPSAPIDSPGTSMPFANSVTVSLKCKSTKAEIRYWKGNTIPSLEFSSLYDGKPFVFNSTTRLQAVAVSNSGGKQRLSAIVDMTYEIYTTAPSDTLPSGSARTLTGGYVFTNLSGAPITAKTHTTSEFSLVGFRDASLAVLIKPTVAGQSLNVSFSRPETMAVSLYRYASGKIEYLSSDSHYNLSAGGEYFVGSDTLPPVIAFLSRDARSDDTTVLKLSVTDNIINPTCKIQSPGLAGGETTRKPGADGSVTVLLVSAAKDLKGLWYRASAGDFYNTGRLPADPVGKAYLSQYWNALNTPAVLLLGKQGAPWDMAGFPASAAAPLQWGKIRQDNPGADLNAMVWNDEDKTSHALEDSSMIKPGMAFWMRSGGLRNSVALSGFSTGETGSDGLFRMTLHHGWNQVTSPLADKVYWPITTAFSKNGTGFLKAPWRWVAKKQDYDQVDSLEPWVGYFAYYYGFKDTVITLTTDAAKRLAKSGASGSGPEIADPARSVSIALDFGKLEPLFLGARSWAQDDAGAEDEPDLPAFQRSFNAWSQRGKRRLVTDLVKFGDGIMHWSVVLDDPARVGGKGGKAGNSGEDVAAANIKVMEGALPAGFQAWAVSKARGMKFRLEPGMEMPWSGLAEDTLSIYAGPLAKLAGIPELSRAVTAVEAFGFAMERAADGMSLRVSLPWNSDLQAEIWSVSGRLLAQSRPGRLNPGVYRLPMAGGSGSQTGFLRIRLQGENGRQDFSRKVLW